MMDTHNSVEATVSSVAVSGMKGGNVATLIGWLSSNEAIALVGVFITIMGFVVNLIFQIRRDRREAELQKAKLVAIAETNQES